MTDAKGLGEARLQQIREACDHKNDDVCDLLQHIVALAERLKQYEPICLVCGKDKPCMTEADLKPGDPGIPCTFDPTPKQLWERLKAMEEGDGPTYQEIARVANETCARLIADLKACEEELKDEREELEHKAELSVTMTEKIDQLTADLASARAEVDEWKRYSACVERLENTVRIWKKRWHDMHDLLGCDDAPAIEVFDKARSMMQSNERLRAALVMVDEEFDDPCRKSSLDMHLVSVSRTCREKVKAALAWQEGGA